MKNKFYTLVTMGLILFSLHVFSQKKVVVVEPDEGIDIGALNEAINSGDTTGNTVYELRRGGLYLLNGAISHTGYNLHIRAEDGEGPRPVLQPAADELGNSDRHFNPGGSLTLEGLYLQGRGELGAIDNRTIVVSGDSNRIILDDCFVDYTEQAVVRLTSSHNSVYITNSIIRNSLRPENPNNGRVVDTRSNPTDSIVIEFSTIYNCSSSIIRMGGGFVNYARLNHNTVYQSQFRGGISLEVALEADITNNVFYNFGYVANNTYHDVLFGVDSMFTYGEYTDADRRFDFSNNNFYKDQEITDIIDQFGPDTLTRFAADDTLEQNPIPFEYVLRDQLFVNEALLENTEITDVQTPAILNFIANGQVDTSNIFMESLEFQNPPPLNLDYWRFYTENNYQIRGSNPPNPYADEDTLVLGEVQTGAFNFSYNSDSRSATAADGGLPLGDPRWMTTGTTSSENFAKLSIDEVKAYPNPFSQNITFELHFKESTNVRIQIFNALGKEVFNADKIISPGINQLELSLYEIKQPGLYFYRIYTNADMEDAVSGKLMKR